MKRFLADVILILILVSVGSYITHKDDSATQETLEEKRLKFEEDVASSKELNTDNSSVSLNDIEDNRAGKMAKQSSEFVVDTIRGTVKTMSDIVEGILN